VICDTSISASTRAVLKGRARHSELPHPVGAIGAMDARAGNMHFRSALDALDRTLRASAIVRDHPEPPSTISLYQTSALPELGTLGRGCTETVASWSLIQDRASVIAEADNLRSRAFDSPHQEPYQCSASCRQSCAVRSHSRCS